MFNDKLFGMKFGSLTWIKLRLAKIRIIIDFSNPMSPAKKAEEMWEITVQRTTTESMRIQYEYALECEACNNFHGTKSHYNGS